MKTSIVLEKFEELATYYKKELEKYPLELLIQKPSDEEWSLGQMYNHLILSAFHMQIAAIEKCANQTAAIGGDKTDAGEKIYAMGAFPPIQIKVPAHPEYTPNNPTNKEDLKQGLLQLIERMKEIEPTLSTIPNNYKVQHPRLGYLNAEEWFELIYMHFQHHLRQKERLDLLHVNG
ncbi:DinB family protein [Bacillus sp. GB_SG_008]|uniref:DinB family protein n=1 Tax=Bacillus sp. GB_SG_008 TaxID=3454627 RepID=UPI003F87ADB5